MKNSRTYTALDTYVLCRGIFDPEISLPSVEEAGKKVAATTVSVCVLPSEACS